MSLTIMFHWLPVRRRTSHVVHYGPARAGPRPAGRASPQPMGRAGPGFYDILRAGPGAGLKLAGPAGPGLVSNSFAGCGPGLGLTFPGLGWAGPTVKVTILLT